MSVTGATSGVEGAEQPHGDESDLLGCVDPSLIAPGDALSLFRDAVLAAPTSPAITYFDATISYAELDELSDAFACWLSSLGINAGDRVMIVLQNVPQFTVAAVGAWKAGAVPVPGNPMYTTPELSRILADCEPRVILCHPDQWVTVTAAVAVARLSAEILVTAASEFQTRDDSRVLPPSADWPSGAVDLMRALRPLLGRRPAPHTPRPEDLGLLLYTSGTTGKPKGAMISHLALAFAGRISASAYEMVESDRLLTLAPLFHITGFAVHLMAAFVVRGATILQYRAVPAVILDSILEWRPGFTAAAITVYIALLQQPGLTAEHFASFHLLVSGGAPVPRSVVDEFRIRTGKSIYPSYGMTETTGATHISPPGSSVPIDPTTGILSIGRPAARTQARILLDGGGVAGAGEHGELLLRGPQITSGYWRKPEETASALIDGWLHTGDVGFFDAEGWFYLIDRKKDMINASGFKVWPREVEDVLYQHPAVREAAVVGVPDAYRGETVKAVVALRPCQLTTPANLADHCRTRLAAYKCPRIYEIIDELPKTPSGKIIRSALREADAARAPSSTSTHAQPL